MAIGRPRTFTGPTTKVSVVIPTDAAKMLRVMAAEQGLTVAMLVDDWVRRTRLQEAMNRVRKAVKDGQNP
jgi:hypothetical protein